MVALTELEGLTLDDFMNLHDPDKVVAHLKKLIKKYPESTSIHQMLSRINFLQGNSMVAAEGFRVVTHMDDQNAMAFYELGICEFYRNNIAEAKIAFYKVIELDSNLKMSKYWLGKCYQNEFRHKKVIEIYSELKNDFPEWSVVSCELGLTYEEVGQVEKAVECFEHVLKLTKKNAVAYYHLGKLYQKSGDPIRALEVFRAGLKKHPKSDLLKESLEYLSSIQMP